MEMAGEEKKGKEEKEEEEEEGRQVHGKHRARMCVVFANWMYVERGGEGGSTGSET